MKDLYRFVNGPWLDTHIIPEDRAVDGTFHKLRDDAEEDVHEIVKADRGRVGALYASFMDIEDINSATVDSLNPDLDKLAVANIDEFTTVLGELDREGVGAPIGYWVTKDSASNNAVAYLVQSGIGLPDEAYYRVEAHAETREAYVTHIARMLEFLDPTRLFGLSPEAAAQRIFALETTLAKGHWDVVKTRDAMATYNPTSFDELPNRVRDILAGSKLPSQNLINMMPSYTDHLNNLLTADRLADWQLWATWHILRSRAGYLAEDTAQANFDFYGTQLSGATLQKDRWKRAVAVAERMVGEEIGKVFVEKHFPASSKQEMLSLVDYLVAAYRDRISNLAWMTPATRERALEKLEKFNAKIGYPEKWRSYENVEFSSKGKDLVENIRRGSAFLHDYELSKVGKPADRDEWVTTPQTVNAFYNPVVNDITFPAAILRAPFFDPEADAAENFGAIGAVIGHEIGHGFDDQGSQYDGDGNLNSWWTDEDREEFTKLTTRLIDQFEGLVPAVLKKNGIETTGVNGAFTVGENIGDLGGLGIAVVAYKKYLADQGLDFATSPKKTFEAEGSEPELLGQEFNGLQRLFLSWARVWRTAIRPQMAVQYLAIDPHSPAEFRCNTIAGNVEEFYEAFQVPEDAPIFIKPEERVTIW